MKIKTVLGNFDFMPADYTRPLAYGGLSTIYGVNREAVDKLTEICTVPGNINGGNIQYVEEGRIKIGDWNITIPQNRSWVIPFSCSEYNSLQRSSRCRNVMRSKMSEQEPIFAITEEDKLVTILRLEYIPGKTLTNWRKISVRSLLYMVQDISFTLEDLEEAGVVHSDIKPGNIILQSVADRKRATLIDFGFAYSTDLSHLSDHWQRAVDDYQQKLMREFLFRGTPQYASPEQVRGEKIIPQSDWFSLGLVLFNLIAGEQGFTEIAGEPITKRDGLAWRSYLANFTTTGRGSLMDILMRAIRKKRLTVKHLPEGLECLFHPQAEKRDLLAVRESAKLDLQQLIARNG